MDDLFISNLFPLERRFVKIFSVLEVVSIPSNKFIILSEILEENGFKKEYYFNDTIMYTFDIHNETINSSSSTSSSLINNYNNENIKCRGCGHYFLFSIEEKSLYLEKGNKLAILIRLLL